MLTPIVREIRRGSCYGRALPTTPTARTRPRPARISAAAPTPKTRPQAAKEQTP